MDPIFLTFLENSRAEALALAQQSDVLRVIPLPPLPPSRYLCEFRLPCLRWRAGGAVEAAPGPVMALLRFPEDYLRSCDPQLYMKVASVVDPPDILHPNIAATTVCLGAQFPAGAPIRLLLGQLYDILAFRNHTVDERNALNPQACRLLRQNPGLIRQLRPAPLVRPKARLAIQVTAA